MATSAQTISELRNLIESLPGITNADTTQLVNSLADAEDAILKRPLLLASLLICFFFLALLGYRYVAHRLIPDHAPVATSSTRQAPESNRAK